MAKKERNTARKEIAKKRNINFQNHDGSSREKNLNFYNSSRTKVLLPWRVLGFLPFSKVEILLFSRPFPRHKNKFKTVEVEDKEASALSIVTRVSSAKLQHQSVGNFSSLRVRSCSSSLCVYIPIFTMEKSVIQNTWNRASSFTFGAWPVAVLVRDFRKHDKFPFARRAIFPGQAAIPEGKEMAQLPRYVLF